MSKLVPTQNFEIYAGDACEFVLVYKDSAGAVITTITKATITFKTHYGADATLTKNAVLDAPNGKMTFTFTSAETTTLVSTQGTEVPTVDYFHDVSLELSAGLSPLTIIKGTVTATGDITK